MTYLGIIFIGAAIILTGMHLASEAWDRRVARKNRLYWERRLEWELRHR